MFRDYFVESRKLFVFRFCFSPIIHNGPIDSIWIYAIYTQNYNNWERDWNLNERGKLDEKP